MGADVKRADYTKTKSNGQLAVLAGSPGNPDEASAGFPLLVPNGSSLAREFFTFNGLDLNDYLNANNDFWTNFSNEDEFFEFEGRGFSASFSADLDWAEFKYIGAWRDVDNKGLNDSDGTPLRLLTTTLHNEQDQWSHEFQLNGSGDIISWIAGASWFQEEATELTNSINYAGSFGTLRAVAAGVPIPGLAYDPSFISLLEAASENNGDATNTSKGVFGQIYIDLTDTVKLTTGARYTLDTREVVLKNLDNKGNCINASNDTVGVCRQSRKTDFDYWSYLVGIDWQATEDVFLYAKTSQSYLAGGFNNRGGAEPAFDPEKVRDVELGAKLDWLNGRLRTNITLFKAEQEAIQRPISVFVNGQPSTFISNAGSTTIQGAEFELEALLWEGMTVSTTIGMMDSEYDKFTETRGTVDAPIIVDRSNEEVIQAPDLTYSISATQEIPLAIGLLTLHADYSYSDDVVLVTQTATPGSSAEITQIYADSNKAATIESYSLINAKASLAIRDSGWTVDIWGRNLGGEEYYARTFADLYTTPLSFAVSYPADPRTYGITARYEF
ncbi:MAG: TonB-dependent receptor [Spongiibacteraceae bacterium]